MKTRHYTIYALLLCGMMSGCSDTWDDHYSNPKSDINSSSITVVDNNLTDYMATESSISSTYQLFKETGMIDRLNGRDQLYTILAVDGSLSTKASSDDDAYTAQCLISDVSLSPSNMQDGQRILMWSGKYLTINKSKDDNGEEVITFNTSAKVNKVIKLNNGYLYIVDSEVNSPRSIYEYIQNLGDNYSTFKQMIMARKQKTFDKDASTPVDVDNTGNTVYDSIFTEKFPFFENKGFELTSENTKATMLIPSNDIIDKTLSTARANLKDWGLERADSVLTNWIIQAAFYDGIYDKATFEENEDLKSVFSSQWRTTVQKVDLDNPVTLSNGVAYFITEMKIPTNVLIYRLKDFYYYYQYLTEEEKNEYYKTENLTFSQVKNETYHAGWPAAGFPRIDYITLTYNLTDNTNKAYALDFIPYQYTAVGDADHVVTPYKVPAGTYDVCLGFVQNKKKQFGNVSVYINGELVNTIKEGDFSSTSYHYDRGGQGYPEGYDSSAASKAGVSKSGNYGRDGGKIGTVTITGEAKPITFRFEGAGSSATKITLHHWCLKPTTDCY